MTRPYTSPTRVVPWRFSYRYSCARPTCNTHTQTIVDWEAVALWRKVRLRPNWQELTRRRFEYDLWDGRDTSLFVGNQEQYPGAFLVLGVFWPGTRQRVPGQARAVNRLSDGMDWASGRRPRQDGRMAGRIYSVGYEGMTLPALVERLAAARVSVVVDVRLNPISRRPGFSRKRLAEGLAAAGIEYVHEKELGNPQDNRDSFREGDGEDGRARMRAILTHDARNAMARLVSLASEQRVALLCVEREHERCHRGVIADMAVENNPEIQVLRVS